MSYPYPQDRHRDRKEKGEQPYKDAREAMSQNEATSRLKRKRSVKSIFVRPMKNEWSSWSQRRQICCARSARVENVPRQMTPAPGAETHNGTSSMPALA